MKLYRLLIIGWITSLVAYLPFTYAHTENEGDYEENAGIPLKSFSSYKIIRPKVLHGRHKRQLKTTLEENGLHTQDLSLEYDIDGYEYKLDLSLNKKLIPSNYFVQYQHQGKNIVNNVAEEDLDFCQYNGQIQGKNESWAAISTCRGLRGVVYDGNNMHYIEPVTNGDSIESPHFIYKYEDLISNYTHGSADSNNNLLYNNINLENDEINPVLRYKRSSNLKKDSIKSPYNSNDKSRYVELILVVDNEEYKEFGSNLNDVNHYCKDIANVVNSIYAPLNIFIALVGVIVWTESNEINVVENSDQTLTNFLHYRKNRISKLHPNDNAHLIVRKNFTGDVEAKALKGTICTSDFSGGIVNDFSKTVGITALSISHTLGHNLGMNHDYQSCECPFDKCIMHPRVDSSVNAHWSSCSKVYLLRAFAQGMDYCLRNKPIQLFKAPTCGNGFVEPGEECDCGSAKNCEGNKCCNSTTCKLFLNATCATGECCDLKTCQPLDAGTVCRTANYECDLSEYCNGHSEYCPDDVYKMDAEVCDGGNAYCYHGSCKTRKDQCRLLWGSSAVDGHERCYDMNVKGSRQGHCGYDFLTYNYTKCAVEDIFCGMLQCNHLSERLEFGLESTSILSHSFINHEGSILPCRSATIDLGINVINPGLTPNGVKCGEGKMCVDQKCLSVESYKLEKYSHDACPHNCSGHGICNSLGHCHCDPGFSPPLCKPCGGGSIDSGPMFPNTDVLEETQALI